MTTPKAIDRLLMHVEGIVRLEEQKDSLFDAIKDLWEKKTALAQEIDHRYSLAEADGFDLDMRETTIGFWAAE